MCIRDSIDTTRDCREDFGSYFTSVGFTGLGLFLSLDRLVQFARDKHHHESSLLPNASLGVESAELASTSIGLATASSGRLLHSPSHASPRFHDSMTGSMNGADGYRLLDFSGLLEHLIQFLRDEELQLEQQLQLFAQALSLQQALEAQVAILRTKACLDDNPDVQWDWPRGFLWQRTLSCGCWSRVTATALRTLKRPKPKIMDQAP